VTLIDSGVETDKTVNTHSRFVESLLVPSYVTNVYHICFVINAFKELD